MTSYPPGWCSSRNPIMLNKRLNSCRNWSMKGLLQTLQGGSTALPAPDDPWPPTRPEGSSPLNRTENHFAPSFVRTDKNRRAFFCRRPFNLALTLSGRVKNRLVLTDSSLTGPLDITHNLLPFGTPRPTDAPCNKTRHAAQNCAHDHIHLWIGVDQFGHEWPIPSNLTSDLTSRVQNWLVYLLFRPTCPSFFFKCRSKIFS